MSGTVLGLALIVTSASLTGTTATASAAFVGSAMVSGAADAAALAAADAASGRVPGDPCAAAAGLARANGAELAGCVVDGATVTVETRRWAGPIALTATATAGPPP